MHRSRKQAAPQRNRSRAQDQEQVIPRTDDALSVLKEKFSSAPRQVLPAAAAASPPLDNLTIQALVPEVSWIGSLAETFSSDKIETMLTEFIDHEVLQTLQDTTEFKKKSQKDALFHALFAVHLYTAASPAVFRAVNAALHAAEWNQLDVSLKQFVRAFAFGARYLETHVSASAAESPAEATAAAAAAAAVVSSRRLYRSVSQALAYSMAIGDVLSWPEIVSCSASLDFARALVTGAATPTIFELRDSIGASCNTQPLSLHGAVEDQYVFLPGTQFKVLSVHVPAAAANEPTHVVLEALAAAPSSPSHAIEAPASGSSNKKRGSAALLTEEAASGPQQKKVKAAASRTLFYMGDRSEGIQALLDEARSAGITVLQARNPDEVRDRLEALRKCSNNTFRILSDKDDGVALIRSLRSLKLPQKVLVYVSQLTADLCQTIVTDLTLGNVSLTADSQVARNFTLFLSAC